MNAYIYQAALYCEHCGEKIRQRLTAEGKAPANPDDEYTYDSDDFPKGPYPDGGGNADCPQHCDSCHCHLENPLTAEGELYVTEKFLDWLTRFDGDESTIEQWRNYYPGCEPSTERVARALLEVALEAAKNNPHKIAKHQQWIETACRVLTEMEFNA